MLHPFVNDIEMHLNITVLTSFEWKLNQLNNIPKDHLHPSLLDDIVVVVVLVAGVDFF
jgi:hypothetical protein